MLLCLSVIVRLVITIVGRSGDDKLVTVPRRYGHYGRTMAALRCIMASLWTPVIPLSAALHYHPIVAPDDSTQSPGRDSLLLISQYTTIDETGYPTYLYLFGNGKYLLLQVATHPCLSLVHSSIG